MGTEEAERGQAHRTRRSGLRRWIVAPLVLVLALLVGEGLLRAFARLGSPLGQQLAGHDPLAFPFEPFGELGFRQKPGLAYHFPNGAQASINAMGFRGPPVLPDKPPGTYRAIILGGSCAYGWGVPDDETIEAYLRATLTERHAGIDFEVVNLSLSAYDSYQALERFRTDGVPLDPDLVILHAGINDVRNARFADLRRPDPRATFYRNAMTRMRAEAETGGPSAWTRAKHYSYLARVPGVLRMTHRRRSVLAEDKAAIAIHPDAADYFEANLRDVADLAQGVGAALILSTPPSQMDIEGVSAHEIPPNAYWIGDAATTREYRERLVARMQRVAAAGRSAGRPVRYLWQPLEPEHFDADCHLTSAGNRALAAIFAEAAAPFVGASR